MPKKSGPAHGVKYDVMGKLWGRRGIAVASLAILALSGCGTTWHHARKSGAEAAADERACAREAEEIVLTRTATPRTEYGVPSAQSASGPSRGETPMELHERSQSTTAYNREFESCMRSKGYTKD